MVGAGPVKPFDVAILIELAGFDEFDRDIATSGLCATFALALSEVLSVGGIDHELVLACEGSTKGDPLAWCWRHALVRVDGRCFDVDGEVRPEHVLDNYCRSTLGRYRSLVSVGRVLFEEIMRSTDNAFDEDRLHEWGARLRAAIEAPRGRAGHRPAAETD